MSTPTYVKPKRLLLKDHPTLDERWLQDRIAEDPGILGLGELVLGIASERNLVRDVWISDFKMRMGIAVMRSRFNWESQTSRT